MSRMPRTAVLALALPFAVLAQTAQTPAPASHGSGAQSPETVLATVDDQPVRLAAIRAEVNRKLPMQSYHGSVSAEKVQELAREAMQSEIDKVLKLRDAGRRGIAVDDAEVEAALEKAKARYETSEKFEEKLKKSGATLESLRAELGRQVAVTKVEAVVAAEVPEVTVADAKAYYDANLDRFREPERAEVRQIFFKMPPNGRTEELWQATEARALEARKRAQAGESFEALVEELSESLPIEKERGGLLGTFHRGQLAKEIDDVVWEVPEGGLSAPVRTFYGVHLFKIARLLPPRLVPFPELQDKLVPHLRKQRAEQHLADWIAAMRASSEIAYLDPYFAPAP